MFSSYSYLGDDPDVIVTADGMTHPNRRSVTRDLIHWRHLPPLVKADPFSGPAPLIHDTQIDPFLLDQSQQQEEAILGLGAPIPIAQPIPVAQPSFTAMPDPDPAPPASSGPVNRLRRSTRRRVSTSPVPYPSNIPIDVIRGNSGGRSTTPTFPKDQGGQDPQRNPEGRLMVPRKRMRNNVSGPPSKRAKTTTWATVQESIPTGPCEFCSNHQVGKDMYAQGGECNFEILPGRAETVHYLECQNCADYRLMHPGLEHVCVVNGNKYEHKRYALTAPVKYPADSVCKRCILFGFEQSCDVDPILGYKCSNCRLDYACAVGDLVLPTRRPFKPIPVQSWYRHACDRCRAHAVDDGKIDGFEKCSWLDNRNEWKNGIGCSRCFREGMACIDSGNLVQPNPAVMPPENWSIDEGYKITWNLADILKQTSWRKPCDACVLSNVKCQVHLGRTNYACERCSQIGVGCVSDLGEERTYWPLYSLSQVGFGPHMPFAACKNCRVNDRPCDRQRPCDSCVINGENTECDSHDRSKKQNTLPRPEVGNLGPLYYLAMGFGGGGVNSIKIGTEPEDWIGPWAQRYAVDNFEKDGPERYEVILNAHEHFRPPPPAKPPNSAQGGLLLVKQNPQNVSRSELREMIKGMWPGYQHPCQFDEYRDIALSLEDDLPKNPPVHAAAFLNAERSKARQPAPRPKRRPKGELVVQPKRPAHARPYWRRQHMPEGVGSQPDVAQHMPDEHGSQPDVAQHMPEGYGSQPDVVTDWATRRSERQQWRQQQQQQQPGNNEGYGFARSMKPAVGTSTPPEPTAYARHAITGSSKVSSGRAPQDARAVDDAPFNPFLGFTMNGKTRVRYNTKPRNSRWKVLNPLEDLDMSHWHVARHHPDSNKNRPRIFNMAEGQQLPVPLRDVLRDVPREEAEQRIIERCVEPNDGGFGYCSRENSFRMNCQSLAHNNTPPYHFPVCNQCHVASINDLFRQENSPITKKDLVGMRAYLCHECAEHISSEAQNVLEYRDAGARTVHGTYANDDAPKGIHNSDDNPDNTIEFRPNPMPGTGCFCADKVLGGWLCRYHRQYYAEEMLKQSKLVHEWRLSYFKKPVCPGCLANKPLNEVNVSADHHNFEKGGPTAWACLTCSEWVVNQKNDVHNKPDVVKGALRTAERITDLLARATEPPEDIEMGPGWVANLEDEEYSRTMRPTGFRSRVTEVNDDVEMQDG
ncbi:hypothetical protein CEP54_015882 [Fusarium duplospermum]|uniref:Zn(2)-C6 fungal-type domain-containing protein n=1 Tax=Fusarium duplospermum TaxID=1325734 RepID=A0A428NKM8_9HYPO|nr:hypothetical protein CEP54_015882 [Fusarium duplospermum]